MNSCMIGNSHTSDSYVGYESTKVAREATNYVKKCLGGGDDDAIIFCGSGSTAAIKRLQEVMGIAVPSILRERVEMFERRRKMGGSRRPLRAPLKHPLMVAEPGSGGGYRPRPPWPYRHGGFEEET